MRDWRRKELDRYVLKVSSPDRAGLIYELAKEIYKYGLNIDKNREFVDEEHNRFFFRAILSGDVDIKRLKTDIQNSLPKEAEVELKKRVKKNIVLMATKEPHCLGDLLIRYYSGELDANILGVIANHETMKDLVEKFDVPFFSISAKDISREEHEQKVMQKLDELGADLIVLAKYMRILSPTFVEKYSGKIINIHHSFLPAFIGANPYKQAYKRGVKIIGATAHYVNNDLDEGPIISQDVVTINHEYSWKDMQKAGQNVEKVVLAKAVDLALRDKIFVYNNKTVIF